MKKLFRWYLHRVVRRVVWDLRGFPFDMIHHAELSICHRIIYGQWYTCPYIKHLSKAKLISLYYKALDKK